MKELKQGKIQQFLNDVVMAEAVLGVIQESFLKARPYKDVYYLAAKSLSVEFLEEARKDLNRYVARGGDEDVRIGNIGV